MKYIALILLVLVAGCAELENNIKIVHTSTTEFSKGLNGICVLTVSLEEDGKFLMEEEIFSQKIPCSSNDDCYEYLLDHDEYEKLTPEFEPYLNCEIRNSIIEPVKV